MLTDREELRRRGSRRAASIGRIGARAAHGARGADGRQTTPDGRQPDGGDAFGFGRRAAGGWEARDAWQASTGWGRRASGGWEARGASQASAGWGRRAADGWEARGAWQSSAGWGRRASGFGFGRLDGPASVRLRIWSAGWGRRASVFGFGRPDGGGERLASAFVGRMGAASVRLRSAHGRGRRVPRRQRRRADWGVGRLANEGVGRG